jgi:chromosome segregation ATPase
MDAHRAQLNKKKEDKIQFTQAKTPDGVDRATLSEEIRVLRQEIDELAGDLNDIKAERSQYIQKFGALQQKNGPRTPEEARRRKEDIMDRIETEKVSPKELKKLLAEVDQLTLIENSLQGVDKVKEALESVRKDESEIVAELKIKRQRLNELFGQRDDLRAATTELQGDLNGFDEAIAVIRGEMSELFQQIKGKVQARDQVRRDFARETDEYYDKRRAVEALEYEKKKVLSEAERLMVQAQEGQAKTEIKERKNPHEKEIQTANSLVAYLEQVQTQTGGEAEKDDEAAGKQGSKADIALIASLRKPSKKDKQKAKRATKPAALAHSLGTLAQFDAVNVTPPPTSEQVGAAIAELKQKAKEWTESFVRAAVRISPLPDGSVQVSISLA